MRRWLLILLLYFPLSGLALIPPQNHVTVPKGLISQQSTMSLKKVVPTNLPPGSDQKTLQTKIIDHSLSNFMADQMKRQRGGIWSAARRFKKLQDEMKVTTSTVPDPTVFVNPEDIVIHEFSFQMHAFQKTAQFGYKGIFAANLKYEFSNKSMNLEIQLDF